MSRYALVFLILFGFLIGSLSANEISAPFGLEWGESEQRLERLLTGAKAKIVERRTVEGRDSMTVEGLVQVNLKRTVFYFRNGGLVEVELQYQNDNWTDTEYSAFLSQLRTKVEQRYGTGKLYARNKSMVDDVTQTIVGYQWLQGSGQIKVIYFSAENPSQVYRTVSLHYSAVY